MRSERPRFVIHEDATCGVDGAVDAPLQTQIGKIQSSNDVGTDGFGLVGLAPVNVGTPGDSCGVENVSRLVLVELLGYRFAVLETAVGSLDLDGAVCINGWSRNFCFGNGTECLCENCLDRQGLLCIGMVLCICISVLDHWRAATKTIGTTNFRGDFHDALSIPWLAISSLDQSP